jgi:hypothetical protein
MLKVILQSLVLAIIISGCAHQGPVPERKVLSGVITADTTLSGRIEVNGDLLVPPGVTLILRPGTELVFLPAANSKIEPRYLFPTTELLVRGTLKAEGTADRPVRFTYPMKKPKAWAGIILDRSSSDIIQNAIVEYAEYGVYAIGSSPKISDSRITHTIYGILIGKGGKPQIKNCLIKNSRFGIFLGPDAQVSEQGNRYEEIEKKAIFPDPSKK